MLSARWARLEVPGDHQDVRVAGQESGQAHLGRRSVQGRGHRQHGGVLGHLGYTEETPSRGEVHPQARLCSRHKSRRSSPERSRRL